MKPPIQLPSPSPRALALAIVSIGLTAGSAFAAEGPLRVAYVDVDGAEQEKAGVLHNAMRENGRRAIYFDYFHSPQALTADLQALYNAVVVRGDAADNLSALHPEKRVVFIPDGQSPEAVRNAVLKTVSDAARKDWVAFLAQREEEVREKNENVANYEKREAPLTFQRPFNVKGSMERTQVPADMRLELFASDPNIGKPIAMTWDSRGRCWVASTFDYPHGVTPDSVGNDKITICEDTNGDGVADKFTTFADKLNIPTGLCLVDGGLMVAQPPNFLFLKDTNGDDVADVREKRFESMWGIGDTHAQASNLHYGYDNWLYGAVGYSGFKGRVNGKELEFRQGTYRFKADGSQIEFLHQFTNNTWGQGYNAAGDQFGGTANNGPIFYGGIPHTAFGASKGMSAKKINVVGEAHPITENFRQVDVMGGYTAAAGASFIYSDQMPARMQGLAMVCEPTMKLVSLFRILADGAGYKAVDAMNIFASSDEWTSPVYAEVGPDGAVWIADWQNFIIQHNPTPSLERGGYKAVTGPGGAHENPLRDHNRGRIYRVVWSKAQPKKPEAARAQTTEALVSALGGDTQFGRLAAQRVLVETQRNEAVPALKKNVTAPPSTNLAIHSLWTLHGLKQLDVETHRAGLSSKDPDLRRNAIRALGSDEQSQKLFFATGALADAHPQNTVAALVKLAEFPTTEEIKKVARGVYVSTQSSKDEWLREAAKMLSKRHNAVPFTEGPNLLVNSGLELAGGDGLPEGWKRRDYNNASRGDSVRWFSNSDKKSAHSGERCITAVAAQAVDSSVFCDVAIKPHTEYRLAAWIKGKGVKGKLSLNDHIGRAETEKVTRNADWQLVETTFQSGERTKASINILFVGSGEGSFDDVSLTELIPLLEPTVLAGDAKRGETVFRQHQTAACVLCHALGGQGSAVGPALDGLATRHKPDYIKQSLVEPNAVLAKGYENLGVSPMPPMNLILTAQELEDIQAFLQTLK